MIISEKQIMQLITIAHTYIANCFMVGGNEHDINEVQEFLQILSNQQSEKLKEIE